jgi:hypothetical protein
MVLLTLELYVFLEEDYLILSLVASWDNIIPNCEILYV